MPAAGFVRRIGANASRAARRVAARAWLGRRAPFWLLVRLSPPFEETRAVGLLGLRDRTPSLLETLRALDAAARDPEVAGVVLRLAGAPSGFAAATALRRAVDALRAAGKPVAAYGERVGQIEYAVASGADQFWLPETGSLGLVGLRSEGLYLARLLARADVRADVVRIGSHKTAAEMFTREAMSPEQRAQTEAYLDDVFAELVGAIAAGRRLDPSEVRARIDAGPYGARAAVTAGLADGCLFPDEVEEALARLVPDSGEPRRPGAPPRARLVDARLYDSLRAADVGWRPWLRDHPHVAYVAATGAIHRRLGLGGISAETLAGLLRRLAEDRSVRAVVLRIASPGGDALASDLLWRALRLVRREKPVVVSMGEVAASGGYLGAVAADVVLAEAATITGSIGVVGGKLDLGGLLERLGVGLDAVERGAHAGLATAARGFTPEERAVVRREMEDVYDVFVRRVAEGRDLAREDVERVAQGRIWSGRRALEHGLVDLLGGPLEALAEARARAGLARDEPLRVDVFPRLAPLEALRGWLGVATRLG
jgi:protease-4